MTIANYVSGAGIADAVPYVSDATTIQRSVPRPFYCTRWFLGSSTYFAPHDWYFYTMSDEITIPTSRLYVDPHWYWLAQDRTQTTP